MNTDPDYIVVGKIGSTYGIKGWLKVTAFTEVAASILDYSPWYLNENHSWKQIKIEDGRQHGKGIIAKLEGYDTPETARLLTGHEIAIKREQLAVLKQHEFYWSDLIGLTVINQDGKDLGKVIYILETGSHDVLVVKGEKEHGIPYLTDTVVQRIDLDAKVIHVNWEMI